ncbi:2-oxoadipate dioxygenase/decarboxylase [Cardamine amara subsp. amara]|uniref:2-oxoadipate dioxygenase/decarboxylase n=1 Tax=Cardamine amara subsp. amara TaxID=228776 RepID=A0ABD1AQN7_CARAN
MISLHSSAVKASLHNSLPSSLRSTLSVSFSTGSLLRLPSTGNRNLSVVASSGSGGSSMSSITDSRGSSSQVTESFFRSVLGQMETVYLNRNRTPKSVLELVRSIDDEQLCYDHLAFRTFGIDGYGIDSLSSFFLDYGYTPMDELKFPAKKLRALWFAPPDVSDIPGGSGVNGPLPRVFISELLVDQLSSQTQDVIRKYTQASPNGNKYAALSSALGTLTWEKPLSSEFEQLARESEYAAWTLVNGYAVNHVTISVHRLKSHLNKIKKLNQFLEEKGFKLNSEGGVLKVSPDGGLLQSSSVADSISFKFSDDITKSIPCSYIEFAERLVLPQYQNIPENEIRESHRRDGFEVGNADKIFESTFQDQLSRRTG